MNRQKEGGRKNNRLYPPNGSAICVSAIKSALDIILINMKTIVHPVLN